jgi:ATP-dependent helicase HrpB
MFFVAVDVEERSAYAAGGQFRGGTSGGVNVRLASAVEPDWLFDLYPDRITLSDDVLWNSESERVEQLSRMAYGAVVLEETRVKAQPSPKTASCLAAAALARASEFLKSDLVEGLLSRVALLAVHFPEAAFPSLDGESLQNVLAEVCASLTSFAELRAIDLAAHLAFTLDANQQRLLENEAPERIRLPGGRSLNVHYERDKPPWIESRLQDFFGMGDTPRVCRGRVPVTLHLLAPNQRAVQVTSDLAGFWERHYPTIRRELMRRYPRHSWPEDGRTATPPEPRPPRRN